MTNPKPGEPLHVQTGMSIWNREAAKEIKGL
jgi:hypothetical protein